MRWLPTLLSLLLGVTSTASAQSVLESLEREISTLARRVQSAVVSVEGGALAPPGSAFWARPENEATRRWLEALRIINLPNPITRKGSGFLIDAESVITSADVVRGAETCTVRLATGGRVTGRVVNVDDVTNLALVKIPRTTLPPLPLGDSDRVEQGSLVVCMGTIGGYERSLALCVVAGRERTGVIGQQQFLSNLIQISGAVGAGSSGAPVVNSRGEVVGVIVASIAPGTLFRPPSTEENRRFGTALPMLGTSLEMSLLGTTGGALAVPINDVKAVLDEMRAGRLRRPFLGVMPADRDGVEGAEVVRVVPNSPAARAGIRLGDVILSLNNVPVRRAADVTSLLRRLKPGDRIQVEILRGSQRLRLSVTLGERQALSP
ncbi:MAG: trypsin-like peptidase domain-containing protein [Armatimonadota bacterium]|nr:trypsin-like peptidase domain-containing protein [Armatimonadota bacterium]